MAEKVSNDFPMKYLKKPIPAQDLSSRINGLTASVAASVSHKVSPTNLANTLTHT